MTTLVIERHRDKPAWLLRALDTTHASAPDTAAPILELSRGTQLLRTATQPQLSRSVTNLERAANQRPPVANQRPPKYPRHGLSVTLSSSHNDETRPGNETRAGNPTPNAGLQQRAPRDPRHAASKLVYLGNEDTDGKMHISRSHSNVAGGRSDWLERLAHAHNIERERWRIEEVRSAPDSAMCAARPWLQRQHTMTHAHDDSVLPPLHHAYVRERTRYLDHFGDRKPALVPWGSNHSMRDLQSHWNLPHRPVRPHVENQIVSHLKRQYTRRIERRYQEVLSDEDDDDARSYHDDYSKQHFEEPRGDAHAMPGKWRHLPDVHDSGRAGSGGIRSHSRPATREGPVNPSEASASKPADRLPLSVARQRGVDSKHATQGFDYTGRYTAATPDSTGRHTAATPERMDDKLSNIADESRDETPCQAPARSTSRQAPARSTSGLTQKAHSKVFDLTGLDTREVTAIDSINTNSLDPHVIATLLTGDAEGNDHLYALPVSPVPTPWPSSRPQTTRAQPTLSREECMRTVVVDGQVHVRFKPYTRCLGLYMHSAGTDTEVERSALIQYTYPPLKAYCKTQGFDLEIVDLSWGSSDLVIDNQDDVMLAEKLIERCHETGKGFSFVTMLGQKHGHGRVPVQIEQAEFDAILEEMDAEKQHLVREAQRRVEETRLTTPGSQQRIVTGQGNHDTCSESPDMAETRESSRLDSWRKRASEVGVERIAIKGMKREYKIPTDDLYPDPDLVTSWFTLDRNNVPPIYRLNLVSSHYPDVTGKDTQKRKDARTHWRSTSSRLLTQLRHYAVLSGVTGSHLLKYTQTSMEHELTKAVFDQPAHRRNQCLWLRREIQDIAYTDGKAREYLDIKENSHEIDDVAQQELMAIKNRLESAIGAENRHKLAVNWSAQGIAPATSRYYESYIARLCRETYSVLKARLDATISEESQCVAFTSPLHKEVLHHVASCQQRAYSFYGRKETLSTIKKYVRSNSRQPLVIHGPAGCGKTSLLCKAAVDVHEWTRHQAPAVIIRIIGLTSSSMNIRLLLRDIILQLCKLFEEDESSVPNDYKSLSNQLCDHMSRASQEKPLVIVLDSLHCLSDAHSARQLSWLPTTLPRHVKLIVSTDPDAKYDCLPQLHAGLDQLLCFLQVPPLSAKDAQLMTRAWWADVPRTVTREQKQFTLDAFNKCAQPLYLRVLFNESLKWSADFDVKKMKLGSNCKTMAQTVYARLERDHGEPLVRRALGYITAARHGVSGAELEDLLSLDDAALAEVTLFCHPPVRRIPPLLWHRLKLDLEPFIQESEADHSMSLRWLHTPFHEAAVDRYLNSRDLAPSYHKPLAEYFLDTWHARNKPFAGCEQGQLRYVMQQGIYLTPHVGQQDDVSKLERFYNYRALSELPYHLLKSAQADVMKSKCLCNFEFLLAKISACSLRAFFEDLQMALTADPNDKDLKLLSDTLQLSLNTLTNETNQLPSQMIARLHDVIKKDVPIAPNDPVNYPFMKPFMAQAYRCTLPALVPTRTCLTPPGGMLYDLLSGHSEPMTAVTLSPDGNTVVTTSHDNTLKLWDLKSGNVRKTIANVGNNVYQVRFGARNTVIVTSESNCLRFWSTKTGALVHHIQMDDACSITVACDTMLLVAFGHGSNVMTTFDLQTFTETQRVNVRDKSDSMIHKNESLIVAQTFPLISTSVLYAFRSQSEACVRNAKTGNTIAHLACTAGASIQALACTQSYYVCAARFKYKKDAHIFGLEYFNIGTGNLQKSARGCTRDVNIRELMINNSGSHALALCPSPDTNTCNIAVWNIATDDHKHVVEHSNISTFGACVDLRYCLTASPNEGCLRVWDLTELVGKQAPREKPTIGIDAIVPIPGNEHTVITKSNKSGLLALWSVTQEKAVSVERALAEALDIVLIRDSTAVILTDKALVGDDARPVYQGIHCYDLTSRKYTHQLKDCFIFPSPAHEFVLLDDEHLLGLSEIRSHFVIWNLTTGQLVHRMKTNFREQYKHHHEDTEVIPKDRQATARMLPWKRRTETHTARRRRKDVEMEDAREDAELFRREKENGIDMYLISRDLRVIVASFYARHICIFDVEQRKHTHTLENFNSLLLLYVSALSPDGSHLVHTHYDADAKISYVTMWNCTTGEVEKRIKNEKDVCCVSMVHDATKVVFAKTNGELRIWRPHHSDEPLRKVRAHPSLTLSAQTKLYLTDNNSKAVVFAGSVSMWDLQQACILAIFTPETPIECVHVAHDGHTILLGLRHTSELVTLRPNAITMETPPPPEATNQQSLFDEEDDEDGQLCEADDDEEHE